MATWRVTAGPAVSRPSTQLTRATGRSLKMRLDEPSTFAFTVDGRSDQALDLVELATDVHVSRDRKPLYTGRLLTAVDDFDDATHTVQASCTDVRGLFARRPALTSRSLQGVDAAVAYAALVREGQTGTNTPLGITVDDLPLTGVLVTRDVVAGSPLSTELQAIAGGTEGGSSVFDWDVTPGWSGRRAQLWVPARGRDLTGRGGVVLDYSFRLTPAGAPVPRSSPVAKLSRSFDPTTYANAYFISGGIDTITVNYTITVTDPDGTTREEPSSYSYEVPTTPVPGIDGMTAADIGTWSTTEAYTDVVKQPQLQALAEQRAAELRAFTPTYTVTLRDGWWQGPDHIWLGDVLPLRVESGRLRENATLRVTGLDIDLGDSGEETVTLTIGPTQRTEMSTLIAHQRRLATLERAIART